MEYPFKDLLPLDEVLDREGYYKDWTHLDPEVFYSLTQISEYIKTKGYGVDVRLLIAQLAEHFGLKTTQVVDLGNLLTAKHATLKTQVEQAVSQVNADRSALETQFNQSVAQMEADKDAVIANATVDSEVILARGGKPTLQARLDETTAQVAQAILSQAHVSLAIFPRLVGETDDTERFKRAIAATPIGGALFIPYKESFYVISDTILVEKNIDFICKGKISYAGVRDRSAFIFKSMTKRLIEMHMIYDQTSAVDAYYGWHGWANDAYVGVELDNLKQCEVKIQEIRNFTTNLKARATRGQGFWFNHVHLIESTNARVHMELNSDGANSWLNGNYFYDTSFGYTTSNSKFSSETFDRFSILQTLTNGNVYGGNSNIFYRQKYEMGVDLAGTFTQIYIVKASMWSFKDYRVELYGERNTFATIDLAMTDNSILTPSAHTNNIVFETATAAGNHQVKIINSQNVKSRYSVIAQVGTPSKHLLLEETNLNSRYRFLNNNDHSVRGLVRKAANTEDILSERNADYNATSLLLENGVTITGTFPIVVYATNLSVGDEITVEIDSAEEAVPRVFLKPFNKSGDLCDGGLINGKQALAHYGVWDNTSKTRRSPDVRATDTFTINDAEVGTVAILITGRTSGFKVYGNNNNIIIKKTMNPTIYKQDGWYSSVAPTRKLDGNFMPKDIVYNTNNGVGVPIGWQLNNVEGTLTWESIGTY